MKDPRKRTRGSWRSLSGSSTGDVIRTVRSLIGEEDWRVHIGTDSRTIAGRTDFVTVIAALPPGGGGRIFYRRERHACVYSLAEKLYSEAELSLQIAQRLDGEILQDIVVHVDANVDRRYRSSNYVKGLAGMVVGFGFEVHLKPDSWCASTVADYLVKDRHVRAA